MEEEIKNDNQLMDNLTELFALEAEQLYLSGFKDEAIELCQKGINEFPDYQMGYSILAKLYSLNDDFSSAVSILETAEEFFPLSRALKSQKLNFQEKVQIDEVSEKTDEELNSEDENIYVTINQTIHKENYARIQEIPFLKYVHDFDSTDDINDLLRASNLKLIPGIEFTPLQANFERRMVQRLVQPLPDLPPFSFEPEIKQSIQAETDHVRKQSTKTKNSSRINDGARQKNEPDLMIVTETIANILVNQGAYDAAIKAYTELIKNEPDKTDYYSEKIEEINSLIRKN